MTRPRSQVLLAAALGLGGACAGGGGGEASSSSSSSSSGEPQDPTTDAENPFDTASPDLGPRVCGARSLPGPCIQRCEYEGVAEACGALPPGGPVAYQPLLLECACVDPAMLAIADVDGDGFGDLLARCGEDELRLWFGGVERPLACPRSLAIVDGRAGGVATLDVDADGRRDLVVVTGGVVSVMRGLGGRDFAPQVVFEVDADIGSNLPLAIAVARIDGDAVDDLVVASRAGFVGGAQLLLGDGAGGFSAGARWLSKHPCMFTQLADVDDDGRVDLLLACSDGARVVPIADGGFGEPVAVIAGVDAIADVQAARLDDDAWIDLVAAREGDLIVARGTGPGAFEPPVLARSGAGVERLRVVDLDGDPAPEILGWSDGSSDSGSVAALRIFDRDDAGALVEVGALDTPAALEELAVGDVNGDGRGELLFSTGPVGGPWNGMLLLESAP